MCRTFACGKHRYDAGAHRFHDRDPEITRDVKELLGDQLITVAAPSAVWDRGRLLDFPPTPLNALMSCGIAQASKIGLELLRSRMRQKTAENFRDFAVGQFGETLARRILLNYSEKLWGFPAEQLSPDIATRRLKGMTLGSLLVELLFPSKKTQHIDGTFLYPRNGYGEIAETIAAKLPRDSIFTGREVEALEASRGTLSRIRFAGGEEISIEGRVVSTLPLTLTIKLLGENISAEARHAGAELRFRHIRLVFLRLARASVSPNASVYIPPPEFCVSRVYEPRNRSAAMAPAGETSLVAEVACFSGDAMQQLSDEALAARVTDELDSIGLVARGEVLEWRHHLLANAYPVHTVDYASKVATIRSALGRFTNLDTIGRAGAFIYSHLHDQLRFGREYVESLQGTGVARSA